jgi:uncharacterized protein involved in exopolysaccharide biosynthesis
MRKRFSHVLLELIKDRYKYIIFIVATVTLFSIVLSFVWPHTYEATGTITPVLGAETQYNRLVANLRLRMLDILYGPNLVVSDVYAKVLRSRRIQSEVITKCRYLEICKIKLMDDAIDRFEKETSIVVGLEGFITLRAKARSAALAAQLVNTWIQALDEFLKESHMMTGSREKEFIENQLLENRLKLSAYKDSLKQFLLKNKLLEGTELVANVDDMETEYDVEFSLDTQVQSALAIYYLLLEDLIKRDVALSYYSRTGAPLPVTKELRMKRGALRSEIDKYLYKSGDGFGPGGSVPLAVTPAILSQYRALRRNVNLYSMLEEMLSAYDELYRILESRDISAIEIVDMAQPPQRRAWPSRKIIVLTGFVSSLVISILICMSERYKNFL